LTGRTIKGTWGNLGRQKEKEMISMNGLRLMIRIGPNHWR
jgi:hypothetical protein